MAQIVKNPPAMWEIWAQSLGWEDPLKEGMAIYLPQHFCLENPHGQRSLAGYSLWDCKELDMMEQISMQCINYNPFKIIIPVVCFFLHFSVKQSVLSCSVMSDSLQPHGL